MSDADNSSFTNFGKFVPGFDFLQNLATQASGNAGQKTPQLPTLGSWVAPTLNVEELDKRIQELKAVQFWLDQNALALKATIQALEVQKMTLSTLKGMNFNMGEMANAFKLKMPDMTMPGTASNGTQQPTDKSKTFAGLEIPPTSFLKSKVSQADDEAEDEDEDSDEKSPAGTAQGVVDPMQWWGALTQQFQTIAADAMKDAAQVTAKTARTNKSPAIKRAKTSSKTASKPVASSARTVKSSALRSNQAWPLPAAFNMAPRTKPKPTAKTARKTSR